MTSKQTPPIVLITGGNRGIGFEAAQQLAARGFHTVIAARNEQHGQQAAEKIRAAAVSAGGQATFLPLDVSNSQSIHQAAAQFKSIASQLNVLINNAGIYPDKGLNILTVSRTQMVETFHTNTFGALEVTQAFLPFLRKAAAPRVINISSGLGQLEGLSANIPSYCLSKLAINGLTIMLAEALSPDGISVNSMCPGWVRTDMGGANATRSVPEGADTAVWLAAEAPHELTGKFFRSREEIPW